jgi:TatD DNase family protein
VRALPPIDLHAHIKTDIAPADLIDLDSLVFAATRSLDEAEQVLPRNDPWTIWGVGCHPGLMGAQKSFTAERFRDLIAKTASVNEVGLDGTSRVPMPTQQATFDSILTVLQTTHRIVSIHNYAATEAVLECLAARPIRGAILHWWLGDQQQTRRALDLGCYFSVNISMAKDRDRIESIPIERVLTETDHPFGDRTAGSGRRPGRVDDVEQAIARTCKIEPKELRRHVWRNLADIVGSTGCGSILPRSIRVSLAAM